MRLGVRAVGIDPEGLDVKIAGEPARITAKTVIWAAGVKASPLGAALGVEVDGAGRVVVAPDLTVPGHPEVFALGDMAAVPGVPGVAQGAIQGGEHVARVIAARLTGAPPPGAFRYKDKGSMATIGRRRAVVDMGRRQLTGGAAYFAWGVIHLAYLTRWEDRVEAVWRWAFTGDRRVAPRADDLDRLAGAGDDGAVGDPGAQAAASRAPGPGRPLTSRAVRRCAAASSHVRCSSTLAAAVLVARTTGGPSGA